MLQMIIITADYCTTHAMLRRVNIRLLYKKEGTSILVLYDGSNTSISLQVLVAS